MSHVTYVTTSPIQLLTHTPHTHSSYIITHTSSTHTSSANCMSTDFQKHRKVVHAHRNGILCRVIGMCEHTESLACVSTHQGHLGRALTAHARSQHMHSSTCTAQGKAGPLQEKERKKARVCALEIAATSCNELQRAATSCNELQRAISR